MEPLGKSLKVAGISGSESIKHTIWGLVAIVLGYFVISGSGLFASFDLPDVLTIVVQLFGIMFVLIGVWFIGQAIYLSWANPQITVYENGVELKSRRKNQQWRWQDFSKMQGSLLDMRISPSLSLIIEGKWLFSSEKGELTITGLTEGVTELCGLIVSKITTLLLPSYIAAHQRGESLKFGKLSLQGNTLTVGNMPVAVQDIRALKAANNTFYIQRRSSSRMLTFNRKSIPNFPVLMAILEQIYQESPPSTEALASDVNVARNDARKRQLRNYVVLVLIVIAVIAAVIGMIPHR